VFFLEKNVVFAVLHINILTGVYFCRILSLLLLCFDRFCPLFADNSLSYCVHGNLSNDY